LIPGGRFAGFWIHATAITNREYKAFVDATGYMTIAERPLDPASSSRAARLSAPTTTASATRPLPADHR
jgi:sulfatase modifying factor 1